MYDEQRKFVAWFNNVALFSMWPLFKKDGLHIPYLASLILWNSLSIDGIPPQGDGSTITSKKPRRKSARIANNNKMASPFIQIQYSKSFEYASYAIMIILHVLEYTVKPPARLPDIHVVLNQAYSAVLFIGSLVYLNLIQRAEKLKIE